MGDEGDMDDRKDKQREHGVERVTRVKLVILVHTYVHTYVHGWCG